MSWITRRYLLSAGRAGGAALDSWAGTNNASVTAHGTEDLEWVAPTRPLFKGRESAPSPTLRNTPVLIVTGL
jgi:hypothetical protein